MSYPPEQIAELKGLGTKVQEAPEGGTSFLLIEGVQMPAGCVPARVDVLLCPTPRDGYASRLYFAQQVQSPTKTPNWNGQQHILGRNWFAFSWKTSEGPHTLAQMVAMHLGGL